MIFADFFERTSFTNSKETFTAMETSSKMNGVVIDGYGGPEVLKHRSDVDVPTLGAKQVGIIVFPIFKKKKIFNETSQKLCIISAKF